MPSPKQFANPFYVILLVVGVLFLITTCGYAVMTVRGIDAGAEMETSEAGDRLMRLLETHGSELLIIELALLGVVTFAAMATDQYWSRRNAGNHEESGVASGESQMTNDK